MLQETHRCSETLWCIENMYTRREIKGSIVSCHEVVTARHRGKNKMLDKFQWTFFVLSACDKISRLVERCDVYLTKERSIKPKMGPIEFSKGHCPNKYNTSTRQWTAKLFLWK